MKETNWPVLDFGRHKNKSLPQVVSDPAYLFQRINFLAPKNLGAPYLYHAASHIKLPNLDGEHCTVVYDFEPSTTKFCGFRFVQVSAADEVRRDRLDLSIARRLDKLGTKNLIRDFKLHYFGNPVAKLSREECEEFFDCDANFYEEATLPRELWRPFPGSALTEAPW
jgi:hypothetical protein